MQKTSFLYNMLKQSDILDLYKKYNVSASKRFGQNFLIDQNILRKIIQVADIKEKEVIEIGPGLGSLTLCILEECKKLTSYEIDKDMIRVLKNEIQSPRFNLNEGDFLKADLTNYINKPTIVANIPYNITSDILFKIFENNVLFDRAIIMMQKEVAERLVSSVGSKNYGKLAITASHFANIKYEFTVPENAFLPAPKVKSAIVSFEFKNVNFNDSIEFISFIKKCFSMRRKTLYNNLKQFLGEAKAKSVIHENNLKESIRPQEITYNKFVSLFNSVKI